MEYTVDYFIKKFKAIPSWRWTVGTLTDKILGFTRHCALGHCGGGFVWDAYADDTESKCLAKLVVVSNYSVADINDGFCPDYKQSTPKARILAALYDIKAKQQVKSTITYINPEPVKQVVERIVYVTVDEPVRKLQQEELILN